MNLNGFWNFKVPNDNSLQAFLFLVLILKFLAKGQLSGAVFFEFSYTFFQFSFFFFLVLLPIPNPHQAFSLWIIWYSLYFSKTISQASLWYPLIFFVSLFFMFFFYVFCLLGLLLLEKILSTIYFLVIVLLFFIAGVSIIYYGSEFLSLKQLMFGVPPWRKKITIMVNFL